MEKNVVLIMWEWQALGNIFDLQLSSGGRQCRQALEVPSASAFGFLLGVGMEINWSLLRLQTRLKVNKMERLVGLAVLALPGTNRATAQ